MLRKPDQLPFVLLPDLLIPDVLTLKSQKKRRVIDIERFGSENSKFEIETVNRMD